MNDLRWSSCALSFVEDVQVTVGGQRHELVSRSPRISDLLVPDSWSDCPGGYLLLRGRVPCAFAISGAAHLSGISPNGELTPRSSTRYSHSLTVPSAPEVINDLLSGLHAAANYVRRHDQDWVPLFGFGSRLTMLPLLEDWVNSARVSPVFPS